MLICHICYSKSSAAKRKASGLCSDFLTSFFSAVKSTSLQCAENKQHPIKSNSNLPPVNVEQWWSLSSMATNIQGSKITAWEHSVSGEPGRPLLLSHQNLGCRHRSNPGNPWRHSRQFSNGRSQAGKPAARLWWREWCGPGAVDNKNLPSELTEWHFLWINDPKNWPDPFSHTCPQVLEYFLMRNEKNLSTVLYGA